MIRTDDKRQMDLPQTEHDPAGLAKQLAAAPLKPRKPQVPCDTGLFGDAAAQLDLVDMCRRNG